VLVFPKITKASLGIGGQYGSGVLFKRGKAAGYCGLMAGLGMQGNKITRLKD
jgi:lipid-binding SYLF domain-containing protein